jgi:hypothetical protein
MDTRTRTSVSVLAVLLLLVPFSDAEAGALHVVLNGKSHHIDSDYAWNEDNYGLGVEYEFEPRSRWIKTVLANGFRDSQDNMSYMAGAGLHRRLLDSDRFAGLYLDAGLTAFVMTRQDIDDNRPFLGALPSITVGNDYAGINLSYIPRSAVRDFARAHERDPNIDGVVFLQFKLRVDRWLFNE